MSINIGDITNKLGLQASGEGRKAKAGARGDGGGTEFMPGDRFRAGIVNATPGEITLRLGGGAMMKARVMNSPDARIGDVVVFEVVENAKGKILLEMVKGGGGDSLAPGIVRGALIAAELPFTAENVQLVHNLAENGMPIDAKTLQAAAYFMYIDGDFQPTFEQIRFLLAEGFKLEPQTIDTFRALLDNTLNVNKNISEMLELLMKLPEGQRGELLEILGRAHPEFAEFLNAFDAGPKAAVPAGAPLGPEGLSAEAAVAALFADAAGDEAADRAAQSAVNENLAEDPAEQAAKSEQDLLDAAKKALHVNVHKDGLEHMGKFYKELDALAARLQAHLQERLAADEGLRPVFDRLGDIRQSLEFMSQINATKEYLQIPYVVDHGPRLSWNQAELHVFKRRGRQKGANEARTALLALDFAALGHVEVLITRAGSQLTLQFRAETLRSLALLGKDSYKLSEALNNAGYSISGLSFKRLGEATGIEDLPNETWTSEITKYSVDVRV